MALVIIFVLLEIVTFVTILEHFRNSKKLVKYAILAFNAVLSLLMWYYLVKSLLYKGYFDNPVNVNLKMNLTGVLFAIAFPRFIMCLLHFSGKLLKLRKGGHIRWLTNTGLAIHVIILLAVASGTFIGRFNFRVEKVSVDIHDPGKNLDGLKIVQISDLHLASFYNHYDRLSRAIKIVNDLKPDILVNTGDFISYGYREFGGCDTILAQAGGKYGSFAIIGNHDMGTYMPLSPADERGEILIKMTEKIRKSGYTLLHDNSAMIRIGNEKVAILGVTTSGRHPMIAHGSLAQAMAGTDSAGFRIFLCHDPNQYATDVEGKTDIGLTLSGHTHGMQVGIITKWFRWSPAAHFYHHWNGLYKNGNQYHYVNRGLGTLAIPFRIWMPPEITEITFHSI